MILLDTRLEIGELTNLKMDDVPMDTFMCSTSVHCSGYAFHAKKKLTSLFEPRWAGAVDL